MLENSISKGSFDNKGSVIDQKKMFADLMSYINKTYAGGMENLSRTTVGMISTIKGIYGSFTNLLFTGSETGVITDKSPLGVFRNEVLKPLADNLIKWQKDGTFKKWSNDFTEGFTKFYKTVKSGAKFLWEHREAVLSLMKAYVLFKGVLALVNFGLMLTNPVGLATAAITALAGMFIYLYRNCQPFREFVLWVGENALKIFTRVGEIIETSFNNPLKATKMLLTDITDLFSNLLNIIAPFEDVKGQGAQSILELQGGKKPTSVIEKEPLIRAGGSIIKPERQPNIVVNVSNDVGMAERLKKVITDFLFEEEIRRGER